MSFGSALRGVYDYLRELEEAGGKERIRSLVPSSERIYSRARFSVLGVVAFDPPAQLVDWTSSFGIGVTPIPFLILLRCDNQKDLMIQRLVRNPFAIAVIARLNHNRDILYCTGNHIEGSQLETPTAPPLEEVIHSHLWLARTIVKYTEAVHFMTMQHGHEWQGLEEHLGNVK